MKRFELKTNKNFRFIEIIDNWKSKPINIKDINILKPIINILNEYYSDIEDGEFIDLKEEEKKEKS